MAELDLLSITVTLSCERCFDVVFLHQFVGFGQRQKQRGWWILPLIRMTGSADCGT